MEGLVFAVAVAGAAGAFAGGRAVRRRRRAAPVPPAPGMSVTLSVLPTRTAIVVLDVGADARSAAVSRLVEHAVRDAFVFDAVEVVEVRRRDGELVERRRRGVLSA
jgi:hypothetical protein